jgi:hypothetical protein
MSDEKGIIAVFKYLDDLTKAIEQVRGRADFNGHEIFSPTSYHEIEHAAGFRPSPVRFFTLVGGMTGTIVGFSLPLLCDYDWPQVVGGKTAGIYSLPAYVIMGFELTILLGAIMTITGMLVMGRIPNPKKNVIDVRFTDDHFGIFVPGADERGEQAEVLRRCGAIEVRKVGA